MDDQSFLLSECQARRRRWWLRGLVVITILCSFGYVAVSRQNGQISGLTSTTSSGCSCHNASPSAATTLAVTGTFTVETGSTTSYTATVSHATQLGAGIDLGVKTSATGNTDAGTLAPTGSDLQLNGTELTHTAPKNMSGSASFNFTWTAPRTPGTYYIQAAGNAVDLSGTNSGDFWNWLSPRAITVNGVELNAPNGGETWCPGTTQNITWTSLGVTNVKIELSSDGGNNWSTLTSSVSAASGSWAWSIPGSTTAGTTYRVKISDASNGSRVDPSNANFTIGSLPAITTQPVAQTICQGQPVTLTVAATGSGLTYQWRRNSNPISGAIGASYSISNPTTSDGGTIDVVVTNGCGSVTSAGVLLTVNPRPTITTQPVSQAICAGQPVTFSVVANGSDLTYQWRKGTVDISGANAASYTINAVASGDAGAYNVVIGGPCNPAATSSSATLTVLAVPSIAQQPAASRELCAGDRLTLSINVTGSNLTYQWRRNGTAIDTARSATLSIASMTPAQAGIYDCVVGSLCPPPLTSTACTVTVGAAPAITTQPAPQTVLVGSNVTFTTQATGAPLTYQWRRNGTPINGATSATLPLTNVQHSDAGQYDVQIMNRCDTIISNGAQLSVQDPGAGALLTLTQSSVDFGSVAVAGTKEETLSELVRNSGDSVLNVTGMTIGGTDAADFTIVSGGAPFTLAPSESRTVVVRFSPTSAGAKSAVMEFTSNAAVNPSLPLQGSGAVGGLSVEPSPLTFDSVSVGQSSSRSLIYCNTGGAPLVIEGMTLPSAPFVVIVPPVFPQTLGPGECDTLEVQFAPTVEGNAAAQIAIGTLAGTESDTVRVSMSGIGAAVAAVHGGGSSLAGMSVVPNPAHGDVAVSFSLSAPDVVELTILDAAGKTVHTHVENVRSSGEWWWRWNGAGDDGTRCASGVYRVLLRVGSSTHSQSLVLVQ